MLIDKTRISQHQNFDVALSSADQYQHIMGVQKKTRKFAQTKRVIGQRDARLKKNIVAEAEKQREKKMKRDGVIREVYVADHMMLPS